MPKVAAKISQVKVTEMKKNWKIKWKLYKVSDVTKMHTHFGGFNHLWKLEIYNQQLFIKMIDWVTGFFQETVPP